MFLAFIDGKAVGRVMGIIPTVCNHFHTENNARFSFLETINEIEVARNLLGKVKEWAKSLDAKELIEPLSFSDKEPQGFLYHGYNKPHVIASNCNFPYQT